MFQKDNDNRLRYDFQHNVNINQQIQYNQDIYNYKFYILLSQDLQNNLYYKHILEDCFLKLHSQYNFLVLYYNLYI